MIEQTSNNKRIAKNTLLLYMRMIILMVVGLYTSRVVLNALGFDDYGIYNVVGGVVMMLQFLNIGMTGASQRFITYDLGKGDLDNLKNTFCTSVLTHYAIAALAVILMESIGIWFLNYKMNIPAERMVAANWVFQCSIVTFAISVISVPYNSCIIAHEKMGTFAYISIFEAVSKLIIALIILHTTYDKLIIYAILLSIVQVIVRLIYTIYCKKHFSECTFTYQFDKALFKKMFSFAGWGCVGNMGFSSKDQLSNILLNLFFGTTVNAARGIATQVSSIISSFASNFTMAMNPQVTKLYASGELEKSRNLVYSGSKYAFYLLSIIIVPFLTNIRYVLILWLGDIPDYTEVFVCIILLNALVYSLAHTTATAILATGFVRNMQIGLALILLSEIPIAYAILLLGGNPIHAMIPSIITTLASVFYRMKLLTNLVEGYSMRKFVANVVRCLLIFLSASFLSVYIRKQLPEGLCWFLITTFIGFMIIVSLVYLLGISKKERVAVNAFAASAISKIIKKK